MFSSKNWSAVLSKINRNYQCPNNLNIAAFVDISKIYNNDNLNLNKCSDELKKRDASFQLKLINVDGFKVFHLFSEFIGNRNLQIVLGLGTKGDIVCISAIPTGKIVVIDAEKINNDEKELHFESRDYYDKGLYDALRTMRMCTIMDQFDLIDPIDIEKMKKGEKKFTINYGKPIKEIVDPIDIDKWDNDDKKIIHKLLGKKQIGFGNEHIPILLESITFAFEFKRKILISGNAKVCITNKSAMFLLINLKIKHSLYIQTFIFKYLHQRFNDLIFGEDDCILTAVLHSRNYYHIEDIKFNVKSRGNIKRCGYCGKKLSKPRRSCSKCRVIFYCERRCQKKDWMFGHGELCRNHDLHYKLKDCYNLKNYYKD